MDDELSKKLDRKNRKDEDDVTVRVAVPEGEKFPDPKSRSGEKDKGKKGQVGGASDKGGEGKKGEEQKKPHDRMSLFEDYNEYVGYFLKDHITGDDPEINLTGCFNPFHVEYLLNEASQLLEEASKLRLQMDSLAAEAQLAHITDGFDDLALGTKEQTSKTRYEADMKVLRTQARMYDPAYEPLEKPQQANAVDNSDQVTNWEARKATSKYDPSDPFDPNNPKPRPKDWITERIVQIKNAMKEEDGARQKQSGWADTVSKELYKGATDEAVATRGLYREGTNEKFLQSQRSRFTQLKAAYDERSRQVQHREHARAMMKAREAAREAEEKELVIAQNRLNELMEHRKKDGKTALNYQKRYAVLVANFMEKLEASYERMTHLAVGLKLVFETNFKDEVDQFPMPGKLPEWKKDSELPDDLVAHCVRWLSKVREKLVCYVQDDYETWVVLSLKELLGREGFVKAMKSTTGFTFDIKNTGSSHTAIPLPKKPVRLREAALSLKADHKTNTVFQGFLKAPKQKKVTNLLGDHPAIERYEEPVTCHMGVVRQYSPDGIKLYNTGDALVNMDPIGEWHVKLLNASSTSAEESKNIADIWLHLHFAAIRG